MLPIHFFFTAAVAIPVPKVQHSDESDAKMLQFIHSHQAKLAAVTAVVGVAAYLLLPKLLPSLLKKKARDPTLLPALTEEEVLRVLNKVFDKLKIQAARMVSAAENIRAQIEQQGQQIDDEKLMRHFILPHFETAMAEVYAKVFDEMEVDEDEVDDAKTFYIKAGAYCTTRGLSPRPSVCPSVRLSIL
jgi:hypothetical protein